MENLISQVRAVLVTTPVRWLSLTDKIPEEMLARPAATGEWSALGCLNHMLDTEIHVFGPRVRALLAGQDFPAFDPDTGGTDYTQQPPSAIATDFARHRAENLGLLDRIAEADLARTVRHAELGPVTLNQQLHEWAAHDLMHTVQAERALMQPFIAGCGPWRHFFADHDLHGE